MSWAFGIERPSCWPDGRGQRGLAPATVGDGAAWLRSARNWERCTEVDRGVLAQLGPNCGLVLTAQVEKRFPVALLDDPSCLFACDRTFGVCLAVSSIAKIDDLWVTLNGPLLDSAVRLCDFEEMTQSQILATQPVCPQLRLNESST